jgi:hypothetical protein
VLIRPLHSKTASKAGASLWIPAGRGVLTKKHKNQALIDVLCTRLYDWWFSKLVAVKEFVMAITRTRRSSLERRCVSKSTKRLFKSTGKTMFKVMYGAECHSRNRKALGA